MEVCGIIYQGDIFLVILQFKKLMFSYKRGDFENHLVLKDKWVLIKEAILNCWPMLVIDFFSPTHTLTIALGPLQALLRCWRGATECFPKLL